MKKIGCGGCTKLEYLESTGTQYIDSGYFSTNSVIDVTFSYTKSIAHSQVLINIASGTVGWFGLSRDGVVIIDGQGSFPSNYAVKQTYHLQYFSNNTICTDD